MGLHLGADWFVPQRELLAILNVETAIGADTQVFLQRARAEGRVVSVPDGPPKSLVVTVDAKGCPRVYLSPISSATLLLRGTGCAP